MKNRSSHQVEKLLQLARTQFDIHCVFTLIISHVLVNDLYANSILIHILYYNYCNNYPSYCSRLSILLFFTYSHSSIMIIILHLLFTFFNMITNILHLLFTFFNTITLHLYIICINRCIVTFQYHINMYHFYYPAIVIRYVLSYVSVVRFLLYSIIPIG